MSDWLNTEKTTSVDRGNAKATISSIPISDGSPCCARELDKQGIVC